jgi:hypothetical protein
VSECGREAADRVFQGRGLRHGATCAATADAAAFRCCGAADTDAAEERWLGVQEKLSKLQSTTVALDHSYVLFAVSPPPPRPSGSELGSIAACESVPVTMCR